MKKTISIFSLFFCLNSYPAQNHFYSFSDDAFKKEIDELLISVKSHLIGSIEVPAETHMTNRVFLSTMYDAATDTLNIAHNDHPSIIHEFGHHVFDYNLVKNIPIWDYFKVRNSIKYKEISKVLPGKKVELQKWKKSLAQRSNSSSYRKYAGKKIKELTGEINDLERVLPYDSDYAAIINTSNIFKRLTPYQELFADVMTINYLDDWESIYDSALLITGNPQESEFRKFTLINDLEYDYKDPYSHFISFKSYLRNKHKNAKDINLSCAYSTIADNLEKDLVSTKGTSISDMNGILITDYGHCLEALTQP